MKVSLSWLKEYLELTDSIEKISEALTLAGLETEGIEEIDDDIIFEIGLTPNLGHCLSIVGIARELSAILNLPLHRKEILLNETAEKTKDQITIKIEDYASCYDYRCRLVKQVKVKESPLWVQKKLRSAGFRSVNNVVDIGNLVMLECGQPLHLFDYDQIQGKQIIIKSNAEFSHLQTLDGHERLIPQGTLLICDQTRPLAFAGVMGGLSSAISETTKNILIEAAVFTPQSVRKTSKLLQLRTDSSMRFERGVDSLSLEVALDMAARLLKEIAGGKICKGVVSAVAQEYTPHYLDLNPIRANRLLGLSLSIREISTLLGRLEILVISENSDMIKVKIPSYRNDLHAEIDLIEEVGRMYGFNHIPRKLPKHISSTMMPAPLFLIEEEARLKLMQQGLQECLTCDLISPTLADLALEKALNKNQQIHVLHPASIDQSVLRSTLLPGLLQVVKFNQDRQNSDLALFEVGHIHFKEGDDFFEESAAGIVLTGKKAPYHFDPKPEQTDFFDLKGVVENVLTSFNIPQVSFERSHLQNFHPGRQARIQVDKIIIGVLGEVLPQHLTVMGIGQRVFYAEINLHLLLDLKKKSGQSHPTSLYPGSIRDWTITLEEKIPLGSILKQFKAFSSSLLEDVFLLDLYKSEQIGKDRKNATFRFLYRDPKKTLSYDEVEKEHQRLRVYIAEKLVNSVL